ncbi:MAG: cytochrome c3 family protein [Kofleriaceae bacterium]
MRARVLALVALAACSPPDRGPTTLRPGGVTSNILRGDYAGSSTCGDCHAAIYDAWAKSPMRNMTRDATTAEIRAPFDGTTLTIGTDTATMEMEGGARFVRITSGGKTSRFRVTKVVGGRFREDFVGVDVTGVANPVTCAIGVDMTGSQACGVERVLPATYVFSTKSWRYKGYSVMVKERPSMSVRAVWANDCIPCHNTLPLATMLYDELYGPGLPAYQGKLSDRLLPQSMLWRVSSQSDRELAAALRAEIAFLGGDQAANESLRATLPAAATAMEVHLDGPKLVELGIGCEACHNGSREHAENSAVFPSYAVASNLVRVSPPGTAQPTRAQWINRTCAKCHTVLFSRYRWTWEGGQRKSDPGGSTTNSGEGRDYQLGGCAKEMACTMCHDPHAQDPSAQLAALATTAGNKLCIGCHDKYAQPAAQRAHSHHGATSAGNACIGCHMPKKNMGLDYALVRYHRIGSPNDKKRVAGDRPLECALCHADKSVESIARTMEQWYRKPIDRAALRKLYGDDLDTNVMRATLFRGKPHEQAVAMMSMVGAKIENPVAIIAPHMAHEYPLVRFYAKRALEDITGTAIDIDVNKPAAELRPLIAAWLAAQR